MLPLQGLPSGRSNFLGNIRFAIAIMWRSRALALVTGLNCQPDGVSAGLYPK